MLAMYMRLLEVNPARAGMILMATSVIWRPVRKPRASGDDPTPTHGQALIHT